MKIEKATKLEEGSDIKVGFSETWTYPISMSGHDNDRDSYYLHPTLEELEEIQANIKEVIKQIKRSPQYGNV